MSALDSKVPIILDGGLSTALEALGCNLDDPLWSARLLIDHPEKIKLAHRRYLEAGADIIITSSYQASLPGFIACGVSPEQARALITRSVELATEARAEYRAAGSREAKLLVAASVGPYGAALADGSEFTGQYDVGEDQLAEFHLPRLQVLGRSEADLLACETIPSIIETRALARLLDSTAGPSAWMSFTCANSTQLRDGTRVEEAVSACCEVERVEAVGVNCTAPEFVEQLVRTIRKLTAKPIVVYPNVGARYDATTKSWSSIQRGSQEDVDPRRWVQAGASVIGGCCGIGPEEIAKLRASLCS